MTVECAFGRLTSRFRIFHRPIEVRPNVADLIIKTACVLHNFLTKPSENNSDLDDYNDNDMPQHVAAPIGKQESTKTQNYTTNYRISSKIRQQITKYCNESGSVSFQWEKIKYKNK